MKKRLILVLTVALSSFALAMNFGMTVFTAYPLFVMTTLIKWIAGITNSVFGKVFIISQLTFGAIGLIGSVIGCFIAPTEAQWMCLIIAISYVVAFISAKLVWVDFINEI